MNAAAQPSLYAYEKSAAESRRRLSSAIDELSASLTPGRMVDEVLSYARSGGGDFLKGFSSAAASNPVPMLLVATGAALFLSGKGGIGLGLGSVKPESSVNREDPVRRGESGIATRVSAAASSTGAAISRAAGAVGDAAGSAISAAGQAVTDAEAAVAGLAGTAADSVTDLAGSTMDGAADSSATLLKHTRSVLDDLEQRGGVFVREQPLVVAAIGLAVGAAFAALLPRTNTEDSLMGEASDAVKEAVGDVAGDQFEKAKTAASRVAEDMSAVAGKSARDAGLSPSLVSDAMDAVAGKLTGGSNSPD